MANDDWLDTDERVSALPVTVELPSSFSARLALAEAAWDRLSPKQKTFLAAWRECRYNARAASRLLGLREDNKPNTAWMHDPDYALVVRVWRANAAASALDKDRLLARQDDIVETLLTPKPVLYQGIPVRVDGRILEEVDAGAAGRANEALLDRACPKPRADVEVNVGIAFVPERVEVEHAANFVIDAESQVVEVPALLPTEEDWLA